MVALQKAERAARLQKTAREAQLERENASLRLALAEALKWKPKFFENIAQQKQERAWEYAFRKLEGLKATPKNVALILRRKWQYPGKEENLDATGRRLANVQGIAKELDVSDKTVRHAIELLHSIGILFDVEKHGHVKSKYDRIFYKWNEELYQHPDLIDTSNLPQKAGGNQYPPCPRCNTPVETRNVKFVRCRNPDCEIHNKLLVFKKGKWKHPPVSEDAEPHNTNLVSSSKTKTSNGIPITPAPPILPENQNGFAELEQATSLYQDIAGDLPFYIGMGELVQSTGKWEKYKDHKGQLTSRQVKAHILGEQTYGAAGCHQDGTTRADIWDADSEARCQLALEAARKLVAAGHIIYIEEPPPGRPGGHKHSLHIHDVYSGRVKKQDSNAAALAIAPELAELEHWPKSGDIRHTPKVRLPGGKYVVKNEQIEYREWCHLTCLNTGETANNGADMARMLLTHQTPASLIPENQFGFHARTEATQVEQGGGALLESPSLTRPSPIYIPGDDVLKDAIAAFEKVTSWDAVFAPWSLPDRNGFYLAMRGNALENEASIKPSSDNPRIYSDYGEHVSRDKLGWWCRVRGIDEKGFKAALCAEYRERQRGEVAA